MHNIIGGVKTNRFKILLTSDKLSEGFNGIKSLFIDNVFNTKFIYLIAYNYCKFNYFIRFYI